MQLPRSEESSACGCCPTPLLNFSEPQNKLGKPRSTAATCRHDFAATTTSIFPNTKFTNPESIPSLEESFADFTRVYPQYSETYQVDQIRAQEYYHLSLAHRTCLDYIGIGLFSYSQLQNHDSSKQITTSSDPPHDSLPQNSHFPFFSVLYKTGNLKTQLIHGGQESKLEAAMKKKITSFLNISENDYCMVFTANRTSAFKLVAESYPFRSSPKLLTVYDYESEAVQTMINCSESKGAQVMSAEFFWPRLRIHSEKLKKMVFRKRKKKKSGLFVFPLHSRVTGARYPYLWMNIAQENGWHLLIDACGLGPKDMDCFGLSLIRPDFLVCSFYKIFGENPSGFGCLFVKKSTVPLLNDSNSSGMVSLVPAKNLYWFLDERSGTDTELEHASKFESEENEIDTSNSFSGPIPMSKLHSGHSDQGETSESQTAVATSHSDFQTTGTAAEQKESESSEIAISEKYPKVLEQETTRANKNIITGIECRGLDQVDSLGLTKISNRGRCLINWLVNALMKLKHPNKEDIPVVRIYGPKVKFDRGPALAFNVFDWKGEKVEASLVQKLADRSNISLSYGFLHHISFSDKYEHEKGAVLERRTNVEKGTSKSKRKEKGNLGITVVTAALGFLANFDDTYRLWAFIAQFMDADFVEKAKWRYTALNQKTVEV